MPRFIKLKVKSIIGYNFSISHNRMITVSLLCTPQGKRKQRIPRAAWQRTVEKEMKAIGPTWVWAEMPVCGGGKPQGLLRLKLPQIFFRNKKKSNKNNK